MKTSMAWLMLVSFLITTQGCGYRLAGGGFLVNDVPRVSVAIFENKSSESRAGISFTNELIREITAKTDTIVVGAGNATRKISGKIQSITFSTLSRSSSEDVTKRQVQALVDVVLTGAGGNIIWSVKGFSAKKAYTVSSSTVDNEANKREAIDLIAKRVAERLVSQMTNNF